ncbi:MAG: DUF998 domain-containing protein [Candidatus Hodarchaeota archaeon]
METVILARTLQLKRPKSIPYTQIICILAIFGFAQFIVVTFVAAALYPGGYDYFGYFFSDLGTTRARNGDPNIISSLLFSISFVSLIICLFPFWFAIITIFHRTMGERRLSIYGSLSGLISFIFGLGVVIYPMDTHFEEHRFFAVLFFSFLAIAILLYSFAFLLNTNYSNYYSFLSFGLFILLGFFETVTFGNYQAFVQKIIFYYLFLWVLIQIVHLWPLISLQSKYQVNSK